MMKTPVAKHDDSHLIIEEHDGALVLHLRCRSADYRIIDRIRHAATSDSARRKNRPIVVDFTAVEVMSSLMMGALVELLQRLKNQGQRFILTGLNRHIRASFAVTRIDQMFEICNSPQQALDSLPPAA